MYKLKTTKGIGDKIRGMFPIKYEVRVPSGNWAEYFGDYQNQKWAWWDSNSCWALSAINCLEDQLEWLWKNGMFSKETQDFFTKYKYIDADGDFSISERFIEILSGVHDNGNNQMEAWKLLQIYGAIPRYALTYTHARAEQFSNKKDFNADYFDQTDITPEMRSLGQEFLKHVNISRQWIGKQWKTPPRLLLENALKQAPLQIGVPVTNGFMWNNAFVKYDGRKEADHAVELYGIDDKGQYLVFDQYEPHLKVLSADFYIPFVTQGIANPVQPIIVNPVKQDNWWNSFWEGVIHWYEGIFDAKVPIG